MSIRILPSQVAAKIAAGEVVERPASVVKELVENALDAGARRLAIEVSQGGLALIRVSDDGCGIPQEELSLAFRRYATSKLASADDLNAIRTLGFRGEALPSIAAVADVEMASRTPDALSGAYIRLMDGVVVAQGPRGAAAGTTVTVRGLFARQPARRKFLRSPDAEARHIATVVAHYALAYPEVRFSLRLDGRQSLSTGGGSLGDAVAAVYGSEVAAAMLPLADSADAAVSGLVAPPAVARASRSYISLFINRRWVQNRRLAYAVEEAYHGLLPSDRHPIAVVHIAVPPTEVDVNVHPTKAEVRFRREGDVFAAVQRAVRQTLLERTPVPSLAQRLPPRTPALPTPSPLPPLWQRLQPQETPETATPAPPPRGSLPMLRVVGQMGSTYIVAEGPDGMYLIDQHAAHERVLFERISATRGTSPPDAQGLLAPTTVELSPAQEGLLRRYSDLLAEHGFVLEPFGARACLLRALPSTLADADPRQALSSFLDRLESEDGTDDRERVAKSLACYGAVRAGKTLTIEEMRELVRQLEAAQVPNTCPHGRPTMIHMSTSLLEREFRRR
ncbi:MAG: DNA mismatch repair endonuclease MutL [Dehalococcoidia bacterium]